MTTTTRDGGSAVRREIIVAAPLAALAALTGCATSDDSASPGPMSPSASETAPATSPPVPSSPARTHGQGDEVEGTVIRFASGDTAVDVTITVDNPTTRDLLARLPMTLSLEEFAGQEKVGRLSPELETDGSPGSDPENGDLISYAPWGSLGFYYNADGVGYSDQTIPLGTYDATPEQLTELEGADVTIENVD